MYVCTGYLVGCFFLVRTPRHLVHHLTLPSPTFVQTSEIDIGQTKEGGQKRGGGAPSPLFVFDYPKGRCTAVCTFLHVPTGVDNPSARNVHILYDGYPCGVRKRHVKNLLCDRPAFVSEAGSVSPRHHCASSCHKSKRNAFYGGLTDHPEWTSSPFPLFFLLFVVPPREIESPLPPLSPFSFPSAKPLSSIISGKGEGGEEERDR